MIFFFMRGVEVVLVRTVMVRQVISVSTICFGVRVTLEACRIW